MMTNSQLMSFSKFLGELDLDRMEINEKLESLVIAVRDMGYRINKFQKHLESVKPEIKRLDEDPKWPSNEIVLGGRILNG